MVQLISMTKAAVYLESLQKAGDWRARFHTMKTPNPNCSLGVGGEEGATNGYKHSEISVVGRI